MSIQANFTELHVAEALLQLRGGARGPPAAASNVPRLSHDNNMEMESAATLYLNCFATPNTLSTSAAALQPPALSNASRYSTSSLDNNLEVNIQSSQQQLPKTQRNRCICEPINISQKMTCDQGTQTEGDSENCTLASPEIAGIDANTTKLYAKIRSLENQLRASQQTPSPPTAELDPDVSSDVLLIERCNQLRSSYDDKKSKKRSVLESTIASARDTVVSDDEWRPEEHKPRKRSFRETPPSKGTELVQIGEGYAMVPRRLLRQIDWTSYTGATRKLLRAVFSRRVLATHSLTGKPSPAFPSKPAKKRLEPELVNDIIQIVVERCGVPESVVRTSITTKCADESKMYRSRQQNKIKSESNKRNQENVPPSRHDDSSDE